MSEDLFAETHRQIRLEMDKEFIEDMKQHIKQPREIAKGHDGWYFNNIKIEPTEEEVQKWNDRWCNFCCHGTIFSRNQKEQIPCPKCLGSGLKEENTHFEWASHGVVDKMDDYYNFSENLLIFKKVQVHFNLNCPGQQDGREPDKKYTRMIKMYYIGKTILEAMELNTKKKEQI